MTDAREMAADLMALSGHQLNLQQRTASSGTERPVCGFYVNSISLLLSLNRNTVCPLIFVRYPRIRSVSVTVPFTTVR